MTETSTKVAPPSKPDSALKSFVSGGVGGVCAVVTGHPFDLVKVRMQTSASTANTSVFGMLRTSFLKDGIFGIYRGVSAPLVATTPMFATSFWGYDIGKRVVQSMSSSSSTTTTTSNHNNLDKNGNYKFSIQQYALAGGLSALPTTLIMAPSERLKCLLQIQANNVEKGGKLKYHGLVDCAKKVYAEGGIRSIFKGTGATLMRDIPGTAAWFGSYELIKREMMKLQNIDPDSGQLSMLAILSAGGLSGICCWTVSIPADVLKSRFQTAPPGQYNGIRDVYRELMAKEGPKALFTGIRPALLRAFPSNAACFLGMELSRTWLTFLD